jgi:sigma-B regulation protein RsbU (phosphoserine phosphatase)
MVRMSPLKRVSRLLFRTLSGRIFLWFAAIVVALTLAAAAGFARLTAYIGGTARSEMDERMDQIVSSMEGSDTLYHNLVSSSMKVFSLLAGEQGPPSIKGVSPEGEPLLYFGNKPVNGEKGLVDNVSKLMGGTATILVRDGEKFIRVSTSVRDASGKRAKGTVLDGNPQVADALIRGVPYTGINDILGRPYYTAYSPLKDIKGKVVGALYTGYDMQALEPLRQAIEPHSVLEKGFIALMDSKGRMILRTSEDSHHPFDEESIAKSVVKGSFHDPDWVVSVHPYGRWNYSVVGGLHLPDVRQLAWTFGVEMIAVLALVLAMVLGVSFWLTSRLSRSMAMLESTNEKLDAAQKRLAGELDEASRYVRSILPDPMEKPLAIDWCFEPSTELGGDAFGYHWIDGDHLAIYLLDVCGHGVGAALLSATAINMIRAGLLAADLRNPGSVLAELNRAFPMERNNGMYFTLWYGVLHLPSRTLTHSSGGHPPALLLSSGGAIEEIREPGMILGLMPGTSYSTGVTELPPGSRLFVFSDGVYEAIKPDNSLLDFEEFKEFMAANGSSPDAFEKLKEWIHSFQGPGPLSDDFTMVRVLVPSSR